MSQSTQNPGMMTPAKIIEVGLIGFTHAFLSLPILGQAQTFPPECPRDGTHEIVENPGAWADRCFQAINGRIPDPRHLGESDSASRDIDLDGVPERLEIRGTGNALKQIYVFRTSIEGFVYLGRLDAHPSFDVERDSDGVPTIVYTHRLGADHLVVRRIQYVQGHFLVRLSPSTFPQLPAAVQVDLAARGCTIPQSGISPEPHNVTLGRFQTSDREDWAVLCSISGTSRILIYAGASTSDVHELPNSSKADSGWSQGGVGFSRAINAVGAKTISYYQEAFDGPAPPPIDHDGLEEHFVEKGSTIHYWHRGSWLELQGAD